MKIISPQNWFALLSLFFLCLMFFYLLPVSNAESPISNMELSSIDGWRTEWTKCLEESECKLINFGQGCYWLGAISKKSEQEATKFLKNKFKEDCSPSFFDRLFTGVTCLNNGCELR